jgi:hypothetical protein
MSPKPMSEAPPLLCVSCGEPLGWAGTLPGTLPGTATIALFCPNAQCARYGLLSVAYQEPAAPKPEFGPDVDYVDLDQERAA